MTRFRSRVLSVVGLLALAGCVSSSGLPAARIVEPEIAAAYIPLHARFELGLASADGAAMVVAPGIAATCAHNAKLVDPKSVIGTDSDYDLMFFRTGRGPAPTATDPVVGEQVVAYGQGAHAELRVARGVVRTITPACAGCAEPAYFTFSNEKEGEGDAGPGFSGGPVVDSHTGRLVGIVFGYKDEGKARLIYAYGIGRVKAELAGVTKTNAR